MIWWIKHTRMLRSSEIEAITEWHWSMATIFEFICYHVHVARWLRKWPKWAIGSTSAAESGAWHVRKSPDNVNIRWYRDLSGKKKVWKRACSKPPVHVVATKFGPKLPWPRITLDPSLECSVNTILSGSRTQTQTLMRTRMLGRCKCKCALRPDIALISYCYIRCDVSVT